MFVIVNKKRFFGVCIVLCLILVTILFLALKTPVEKQIYPQKYKEFVQKASAEYGVDELLIYSVMKAESKFNDKAMSSSGAKGLMQLMDETAAWVAEKSEIKLNNIYDPETNIRLGTWYLAYLLEECDDTVTALACYNAGVSNVEKWCEENNTEKIEIEQIQFEETRNYVKKILKYYEKYKQLYGGR